MTSRGRVGHRGRCRFPRMNRATTGRGRKVVRSPPALTGDDAIEIRPFRAPSRHVDIRRRGALGRLVGETMIPGEGIVDAARRLCTTIFETFEFDPTFTGSQHRCPGRRGTARVCQTSPTSLWRCSDRLGFRPATSADTSRPRHPAGAERLVGADASCTPGARCGHPVTAGSIFDPTNGHLPVSTRHVGRGDYADVTPVRGVVIGPASEQRLDVAVDVTSDALS